MSIDKIKPLTGTFNVTGDIKQHGKVVLPKESMLVLSEQAIYASATVDTLLEPKVIGIDISAVAYDSTTGLIKAKTISSLTSQEILGVAISTIPISLSGVLVTRGIITSTLTGVTVGSPVYATSFGTLSLSLSSRRIGYILTLGANAKVFVDIRTENTGYWDDLLSGALVIPSSFITSYPNSTAPSGWLLCDGASYLTATYPDLFSVIGYSYGGSGANFNVPDYRGMFLRGTGTHGSLQDAAGGNFSGPALHGNQLDMSQSHKHVDSGHVHGFPGGGALASPFNFPSGPVNPYVGIMPNRTGSGYGTASSTAIINTPTPDGVNGTPRVGTETRPVSYGTNWIIKV